MAKGGTGFFLPRVIEDVAPQLGMRSTGSSGLDATTRDPNRSDSERHRRNNKRFGSGQPARSSSLGFRNSGATSRAGSSTSAAYVGNGAMSVGGATACEDHTAPRITLTSWSPNSRLVLGSPPVACEFNNRSPATATGAVPVTDNSTTSSNSCDWLSAPCLIAAALSGCSGVQLSAESNLQMTGSCEPPGAAVDSWDTVELLGLSLGAAPGIRTPSTSSCSCPTPFVSAVAAGSGPCHPAAAPGSLTVDCTNSLLLNGLELQAAVPAQDEVSPTDALIPVCGSTSLQTSVAPQDMQQAVPHSSTVSAAETLLQLRSKLSAARAAAMAQADVYGAPCCTSVGGSLWGPGGVDGGRASALDILSPTLDLLGGNISSATLASPSVLAGLSPEVSSSFAQGLPNSETVAGLCSSGSLYASGHPLASAGQHVVGNEVALAAAMAAQDKLAQLVELDTMYEQLCQECVQLLQLI